MRRRTKRRLGFGALLIAAVGGYVLFWPKDLRPKLNAFGSGWAIEELEWAQLFDHHALSFDLNLDRGLGEVEASANNLTALCETVLSALPNPPNPDLTAKDVYRISFNIKNQRRRVFDEDIAISVIDGTCQERDLSQPFVHVYPAPMTDWTLRADLDVSLTTTDAPEYSFKWDGDGEPDLDLFPFQAACTALLLDPPAGLAPTSGTRLKSVTIWAEQEVGEVGSGQFTAKTQRFEISDGACIDGKNS